MEQYQKYYIISTRPKVFRCNRGIEEDVWLHADFKWAGKLKSCKMKDEAWIMKDEWWRMKDDAWMMKDFLKVWF